MKLKSVVTAAIFLLTISGVFMLAPKGSFAEDPGLNETREGDMENMEDVGEMEPIEVGNKICPVDGKMIEEGKEHKVQYNGQILNLCSAECEKEFFKNPESYVEKMEMQDDSSLTDDTSEDMLEGSPKDNEEGSMKKSY